MTDIAGDKQLSLIKAIIRTSDYSHPVVLISCKELGINPEELKPRKTEDFADKKTCLEIHELRFRHYETKRRAKLEQVALKIMKSGTNLLKLMNKDLGPVHFQRYSLSPEQVDNFQRKGKLESTLVHPLTTRDLSQKKLEIQKKKLERIVRVMGNIKEIKYLEEVKKKKINNDLDMKHKKITEEKQINEEKRIKKIHKINTKREEILKKKQQADQDLDLDFKVKVRVGNQTDRISRLKIKESKTSFSCRSVSKRND
jgi:hypothetical protein